MRLTPGARIGPFEVLSTLGAGGMGEVFRARDTRLNRDVAIKILPDLFATDAERVARFTREAQTLASLNHPHIAQIYGVEEVTPGDGGRPIPSALIMELVEGDDLAQRLAHGPIPIEEALSIAAQIAAALEAAHEQGVVHRDLKPANVKLRADGTVKVLDFGLAKAMSPPTASAPSMSALQHSPTITTPAMTMHGVILGTAAYMSPEQAKGKAADQRSDVWAFGCVLYEMLTGRRTFDGDDVSETLAAVLRSDPDLAALPDGTPPAIRTLIRRCLERDPRRRIASLSTARFVIDEAAALDGAAVSGRSSDNVSQAQIQAAVASGRRQLIRRLAIPFVVVLAAAAVAIGMLWSRAWRVEPPAVTRFGIAIEPRGFFNAALGRPVLGLSNDGRTIVYFANRQVFLRPLSEFAHHALTVSEIGSSLFHSPVFSPDDSAIAFFGGGVVKRVNVGGGAAVLACRVAQPWGMTWHQTGLVVGLGPAGIVRCAPNSTEPERLVTLAPGEQAQGPQLLPDGDSLLFTLARTQDGFDPWDKAEIVVESLRTRQRTTIIRGGADARYLPTGHLVYAVGGVVFAVPFDSAKRELRGQATQVIEGVRRGVGVTGQAYFFTSATGTLMFVPGPVGATAATWSVAIASRTPGIERVPVQSGPLTHVRASPDGSRLAIAIDDGREANIWIHRLGSTSAMRRLTLTGRNRYPVWLPDGQRVAFESNLDGVSGIFVQRADGTSGPERLTKATAEETHLPEAWSRDGRLLVFAILKQGKYTLWTLNAADQQIARLGAIESMEAPGAVFSPDGRWLAYASTPVGGGMLSQNRGVFVQPFPFTGSIYQAPSEVFDFHPVWNPKGLELIYVPSATLGEMSAVTLTVEGGIAFGKPVRFPAQVTAQRTSNLVRGWDILPDGRFVGLINAGAGDDPPGGTELRVVLNWFEELRQRVPTER